MVSYPDKTVSDQYSTKHSAPPDDTKLGGKDNLQYANVTVSGGTVTASFVRLFDTGDKYDAILIPNSSFTLCFAYRDSGSDYDYHSGGYGSGTLNFFSTQALSTFGDVSTGVDYGDDYSDHGKAMSIVWMCLAPLGLIAARYFKSFQLWFYVHMLLMGTSTFVTVYSVSAIYKHNKGIYDDFDTDQRYHSRMGLMIGSVVLLQGFNGMLIRWFARKKETLIALSTLRLLHKLAGWTLTIIALIEIKYGWDMKDDDKLDFIYPLYAVIIVIFMVFEAANRFGYKLLHRRALPNYTYREVLDQVEQGKQWAFFNGLVIDVNSFASSHPGGLVVLQHTLGQDLGKYIYGSSSWFSPPHIHTVEAHSLIAQLAIGRATGPNVFSEGKPQMKWRLVAKAHLNNETWRLTFKSETEVLSNLPGVEWVGKHLLVTFNGCSRYYSFVNCIGKEYSAWHSEARRRGAEVLPIAIPFQVSEDDQKAVEEGSGLLSLVVKRYAAGRLSPFLTAAPLGASIQISGPFGPGLDLSESFTGDYVGFAGGTGLLPFLDLAHLLWKRVCGETSKLSGLRFILHVSFSSKGNSFCLDLLKALEAASPQTFRLHTNFTDVSSSPLNEKTVSTLFDAGSVSKVAICGPSSYNRVVEDLLEKAGVNKAKVLVL